MDKLIVTYALIRCQGFGEDHLDCFWPFALRIIPTNKQYLELPDIKASIKANFGLEIPMHSLTTILRRAEKKQYLTRISTSYALTEKAIETLRGFESESEVERRMNALYGDIQQFIRQRTNATLAKDDISAMLSALIRQTVEPLVEFFNPNEIQREPFQINVKTTLWYLLAEYMELAEKEKPEQYKTLHDIMLGSLLSVALNAKDISKILEAKTGVFKGCVLFLDSNFVFSVLGLHEKEFVETAKETLSLIRSSGFAIKVFNFTVDEICRVMSGYLTEGEKYPSSIAVENSIYSNLKRQGWTKTDVQEFIIGIDNKLLSKGIEIDVTSNVDLDNYEAASEKLRSAIAQLKYKPMQPLFAQNHDLAALETIQQLRKHPPRRIEHSKALFFTSDKRLSAFNFIEMGHKANGTIAEVILDSLLTNIIWLRDPKANISLKSIIATHSRKLFVKRDIWLRFYDCLKKIKQDGKADNEAISTLFYGNYIAGELAYFDESRIDAIDEKFVLGEIEKAGRIASAKDEKKESDFIKHLADERSKAQAKEQQFLNELEKIRSNLGRVSDRRGKLASTILATVLSLALCGLCWFIYDVLKIQWAVPLIVSFGGVGAIWSKFRPWFRTRVRLGVFKSKLKEVGLKEAEKQ